MPRSNRISVLKTTRANLVAQGVANNLIVGEPYYITDEARLAVGTATNAFSAAGRQNELANVENNSGNSAASLTIGFGSGSLQRLTLIGACALTLQAPGVGYYQLRMTAGSGAAAPTFATPVNWFEASVPPAVNLTSGKNTILSFYYDGTAWYGSGGRFGL